MPGISNGVKVNRHQAAQAAMVEEQVEPIIVAAYPQRILEADEAGVAAEFGAKLLEVGDNGGRQVLFRIRIFEAGEIEQVRVLKGVFVAHYLNRAALLFEAHEGARGADEGHPLKQGALNLTLKLAGRPPLRSRLLKVEGARQVRLHAEQG